MRIQHNIMAMNAYRNYNTNTSALSKNLEKLSSGYKINRAGDDAAGLAISEKMRAQITGLDAATKNVKDGISLVKTAEGAMQEIQDMLNRMDYLATQSANGTYDDPVDRANLQKEVTALKTEINRIADSANFNGIKLLDGSLAGKSQADNVTISESTSVKGKYETGALTASGTLLSKTASSLTSADIGKTMDYTVSWKDASGNEKTTTVSLTFQGDGTGAVSGTTANNYFTDAAGAKYMLDATNANLSATNLQSAIKNGLTQDEEFSAAFTIATSGTGFTFEAKENGSAGAIVTGIGLSTTTSMDRKEIWDTANQTGANTVKTTEIPLDSLQKFSATGITMADSSMTQAKIEEKIFEIDGKKFLITNQALTDDQVKALGDDVTIFKAAGATLSNAEVKELAATITKQTGLETKVYGTSPSGSGITANTDIVFTQDRLKLGGQSLTLQIGDTADAFNQMDVKVGDMHVSALGIESIDISNIDGAQAAIAKIKDAINSVSGVRGDLGAFQNRLEHTQKNLSVMKENIQDAESTIRDTDVAEEMMSYTKNNILIQSAQAMLAQANAVPQGVLQLLG